MTDQTLSAISPYHATLIADDLYRRTGVRMSAAQVAEHEAERKKILNMQVPNPDVLGRPWKINPREPCTILDNDGDAILHVNGSTFRAARIVAAMNATQAQTPQPARVVTDEMVEAALSAWYGSLKNSDGIDRQEMRAALVAALGV